MKVCSPRFVLFESLSTKQSLFDDKKIKINKVKDNKGKHLLHKFPLSHDIEGIRKLGVNLEAKEEMFEKIQIGGRILAARSFGKLTFFKLFHGGDDIQLYVSASELGEEYKVLYLTAEGQCFVFFCRSLWSSWRWGT